MTLAPALPPLKEALVMRKEPWEFIERTIFGTKSPEQVDGPKILAVTGVGGCGKTQIILKFLWVHEKK